MDPQENSDISDNSDNPEDSPNLKNNPQNNPPIIIPKNPNISDWDNPSEEIVKGIGENCQGYKFMHYQNSRYYSRINNICMYASMIICPIAGTLSAINIYFNNSPWSVYISIVIALITYIATVKVSIVKFSKFSEKSNSHEQTSKRYAQLENNIRIQLMLNRKNRVNVRVYLNWLTKIYDEIYQGSPVIKSWIYSDYIKMIKNFSGIIFPGKYDSEIRVNNDIENQLENLLGYTPMREFSKAQMEYEINRLMAI